MPRTRTTLAGDEQITFTTLPLGTDLAAAFPQRLLVAQLGTRTVWGAKPGRNVLLIVDERDQGGVRSLLLVIAFRADAASLAVYAQVAQRLAAAALETIPLERVWYGKRRYKRYPFPPIFPSPPREPEPVYGILPVPPFVPVPEHRNTFTKTPRRKRGRTTSGADSNYHVS